MKKWIAGMLAALLLLAGIPAGSEESEGVSDAELQESVQSREDESLGTLSDNILFLVQMLQNDDFRNLLQIQDVKDLLSEGIWKVTVWMYQNRSVTMKILTELGVSETDRQCVSNLWDSAERLSEAGRRFNESEEGRQLAEATQSLRQDQDFRESLDLLSEAMTSEDVSSIVGSILQAVKEGAAAERQDGVLARQAVERQLDRSSFIGSLVMQMLTLLEENENVSSSVQKLLKNENLWQWLILVTDSQNAMDKAFGEEVRLLSEDPEMAAFISRTAKAAADLFLLIRKAPYHAIPAENAGETSEEVIP